MSMVSSADILAFLEVSADDSYGTIAAIHAGVEQFVNGYCNRTFEDATYKEFYNGTGMSQLVLRQSPINSIARVSLGSQNVMMIKNTNEYTSAVVSVTDTNLVLAVDGGASTSLAFATYATLSSLIAAVNAVGGGWFAELSSNDYATFKSQYLFKSGGKEVINSQWMNLIAPYMVLIEYDDIHPTAPIINRRNGWPKGNRNIYIEYNAGYTTVPADLQYAVKILAKAAYAKHQECTFGVGSYSIAGVSKAFEGIGVSSMPNEAKMILDRHRRTII